LLENSLRKRGAFRSIASAGKDAEKPVVYAGNYTLEKAIDAGFTEVVNVHVTGNQLVNVVRDDLAPGSAEAIALGLEDNEIGRASYNPDLDILAAVMADPAMQTLRDEDRILAGLVDGMGLPKETADAEPQIDRAAELLEKWQVKPGDLWQIGAHRLLCGDSTRREDVERVINKQPFCVLTDPPYNIGFNYNGIDDEMTVNDYAKFCRAWFENVHDAICLIFTPGPKNVRLYPEPRDYGFWRKRNASAGASAFNLRTIEPVLIYGKIGQKRNFDIFDYSSGFTDELRAARCAARVEDKHPPAKPLDLWLDIMEMLPDVLILDLFPGNGTTFMAAENKKRPCAGIELDPQYCVLILERMATAFPGIEIKRL
jgi:DNA modification methylase